MEENLYRLEYNPDTLKQTVMASPMSQPASAAYFTLVENVNPDLLVGAVNSLSGLGETPPPWYVMKQVVYNRLGLEWSTTALLCKDNGEPSVVIMNDIPSDPRIMETQVILPVDFMFSSYISTVGKDMEDKLFSGDANVYVKIEHNIATIYQMHEVPQELLGGEPRTLDNIPGLVGQPADLVLRALKNFKIPHRVVKLNGQGMAITDDLVPGRVSLEIDNGLVTKAETE